MRSRLALVVVAAVFAACAAPPAVAAAGPPPDSVRTASAPPELDVSLAAPAESSLMSPVKVFWLEPTTQKRLELRRYANDSSCSAKPYGMQCHDARVALETIDDPTDSLHGYGPAAADADSWKSDRITRADPRWPSHCACGYAFADDDTWQVNYDHLYEARGGPHDGALFDLREAPPGAMWDASWYRDRDGGGPWTGPDGISLVVKLPNGHDWCVDQQASNCTRPQWGPKEIDGVMHKEVWLGRTHYCWIRHGDPRTGELHVDKAGDTCAAGAGSILAGNYHGFLHHGYLTD